MSGEKNTDEKPGTHENRIRERIKLQQREGISV
jgi:hypothetical protein